MLLLLFVTTCKKPEDIGLSTLPPDDLLYTDYADSTTIVTTTISEDTLRADELSRILIGSMRDTAYGLTNVSYTGQILISSTPNLIADSTQTRVADSLVLSLAYVGVYGDSGFMPRIRVHRLTEDIYSDSAYYSNRVFQVDPTDLELTQSSYSIRPTTPVVVGSDTNAAAQIRIRLSDTLRDEIFDKNSETEFVNNDNWKAWFKGLNISVDPAGLNEGAIMYFNPTSAYTRMTLYYREGTESKSYSFTLSGGARATQTSNDYTGTGVKDQLDNPATQFDYNYIQPFSGLKTKVSFPYLQHFKDSGSILINKADLVITVLSDSTLVNQPVPENLLFLAKSATGTYEFPIDYFERSYGGSYSVTARTYTFGITRTIQRILDGTITDNGFSLNILGSMIAGNRVIIGSGKTGISQMKLKIYYTKLH